MLEKELGQEICVAFLLEEEKTDSLPFRNRLDTAAILSKAIASQRTIKTEATRTKKESAKRPDNLLPNRANSRTPAPMSHEMSDLVLCFRITMTYFYRA